MQHLLARLERVLILLAIGFGVFLPDAAMAGVVGTGVPGSCTEAALQTQLSAGGTVTFNCGGGPTTINIVGGLSIGTASAVTLDGGNLITLDGGGLHQILSVNGILSPGVLPAVALQNISFANGNNTGGLVSGGAILNFGNLTINNVTFTGNRATGAGGAIMMEPCTNCANSSLLIQNSRFLNNTGGSGGAIGLQGGALIVNSSAFSGNSGLSSGAIDIFSNSTFASTATISGNTFTGNTAVGTGGAIGAGASNAGSAVTLSNNTFTGNVVSASATPRGGAIYVSAGTVAILNNTIANNSAGAGGGIYFSGSGATVTDTIIAGNTGGNCGGGGGFTNGGNNLQFGDASCAGVAVANPLLGALANNGGPTQTMALGAGSPAIDAGSNITCAPTDQRGIARPQPAAGVCDIGAFEFVAATYAVVYNTNGGVGTTPVDPNSPYASGALVTVLGVGNVTNSGFTFAGWNEAALGNSTAHAAGSTFNISGNVTLYAQWTAVQSGVTSIPTLGEWGMLTLSCALLFAGMALVGKRR